MILKDNEEIIGRLANVTCKNGGYIIQFFYTNEVHVPSKFFNYKLLQKYVGQKIGLFRCDDCYYIKELDNDGKTI